MKYQTMDVILFRPAKWNLFGRLIAWITGSPFSHTAVVLDGETGLLIEATATVKTSSLRKDKRHGEVWRYRRGLTAPQVLAAERYLVGLLGTVYDFGNLVDIFINLFRRAFGRPYRAYFQSDGRPVCSELVSRAYGAAGVTLCPGKPLWVVTPADLASCGFLERVV